MYTLKHLYTCVSNLTILVSLALCLVMGNAHAQDFEFGKLTRQDSSIKSYSPQPGASGVILQEFGNLYFQKDWPFYLVHVYHTRIKIIKPDALEYGNIKISCQKWADGRKETIENFKAVVFTPDGTGNFKKMICDITGYQTTENKNENIFTYAMPSVTVGSIIEYRYELATPNLRDFTPWIFQSTLPKIHSEYHVHIPVLVLDYKVSLKGNRILSKNYKNNACVEHSSLKCSEMIYAMDSIPAFKYEDRLTNIKDYIPALYFDRVDYAYNSKSRDFLMKTWGTLDAELKNDEDFGGILKNTGYFKQKLKDVIPVTTDTLSQARMIYTYINHNVKLSTTRTNAKKALNEGRGNTIDINLMLASTLNAYGIKASPVLLSTRSYGEINKDIPALKAFNYMVVKTRIQNRDIYLDATDPILPFGMIPDDCYNNEGRVFSMSDSCYWIKMQPIYKANKNYIIDLQMKNDGSISGMVKCYYLGYGAYLKRKQIKEFATVDEYREQVITKNNRVKIKNITVNALDSINNTLWETYDIDIPNSVNNTSNKVFFNPYVIDLIIKNPFNLDERTFPLNYGPASEERFVLNLTMPENMQIENPPAAETYSLPNNGGAFITNFRMVDNSAFFSHLIQLNRSVYMPEEYPQLKELFNKIIQAQKADIVFVKK